MKRKKIIFSILFMVALMTISLLGSGKIEVKADANEELEFYILESETQQSNLSIDEFKDSFDGGTDAYFDVYAKAINGDVNLGVFGATFEYDEEMFRVLGAKVISAQEEDEDEIEVDVWTNIQNGETNSYSSLIHIDATYNSAALPSTHITINSTGTKLFTFSVRFNNKTDPAKTADDISATDNFTFSLAFLDNEGRDCLGETGLIAYDIENQVTTPLTIGTAASASDSSLDSLTIHASDYTKTGVIDSTGNTVSFAEDVPYKTATSGLTVTPVTTASTATVSVTDSGGNAVALTDGAFSTGAITSDTTYNIEIEDSSGDSTSTTTYVLTIPVADPLELADAEYQINVPEEYTLSPSWDKDVTDYTISVPYATTSVELGITGDDKLAISESSQTESMATPGDYTYTTTVEDETGTSKTYTVTVTREEASENVDLASIQITANSTTNSASMDSVNNLLYTYTFSEGTSVNATTYQITVNLADSTGKVYIRTSDGSYNTTSNTILGAQRILKGGTNTYYIKVVPESGTDDEVEYTLTVKRNSSTNTEISTLNVTEKNGTDIVYSTNSVYTDFMYSYTLQNSSSTSLVLVATTKANENADYEILNSDGVTVSGGTIDLAALTEGTHDYVIKVIAQDGVTTAEYDFKLIIRSSEKNIVDVDVINNETNECLVDTTSLETFRSGNTYTFSFSYASASIIKYTIRSSDNSTITAGSGVALTLSDSNNGYSTYTYSATTQASHQITLTVTAENGTSIVYTIIFVREAADTENCLSDIKINGVSLTGFSSDDYNKNYSLLVLDPDTLPLSGEVEISVTKKSEYSKVVYNDSTSNLISFSRGTQKNIIIKVTSQSGAINKYNIPVVFADDDNTITNIVLSGVSYTFSAGETSKTIDVAYSFSQSMNVAVTASSSYAKIYINGSNVSTNDIVIGSDSTTITVYAVSESGTKGTTYTFTIDRQAARTSNYLDSLTIVDELGNNISTTLNPNFISSTNSYTLRVDDDATLWPLTISATAPDDNGSYITTSGTHVFNQEYSLASDATGQLTINVYDEAGNANPYTLTISRKSDNNKFTSVTVNSVEYNATNFDSYILDLGTFPYTTSSLPIAFILEDSNASLTAATISNALSGTWNLTQGIENTFKFKVTSQAGTVGSEYTIKVTREAPNQLNDVQDIIVYAYNSSGVLDETIDLLENIEDFSTNSSFNLRVDRTISKVRIIVKVNKDDRSTVTDFGAGVVDGDYLVFTYDLTLGLAGNTKSYTISVKAEDTSISTNDFTVNVTRKNANTDINQIQITDENSDEVFNSTSVVPDSNYDLGTFPYSIEDLQIVVTKVDKYSKVYVGSTEYGSGLAEVTIPLSMIVGEDNVITVRIETDVNSDESDDFKSYEYTFVYTRNAAQTNNSLNNLEIFANSSDVLLTQDSFDSTKSSYEVRVDRNIDTASICVYLEDLKYSTIDTLGFNKVSTLAGISKYEYDLTLTAGTKNTLEFYVSSESGASKKYTINVHAKNAVADFSNLDIDGSLDLVTFAQSTTSYDLGTFPYSTSQIGIVLAKADKYSKITIDGTPISEASGISSYTYTKSLEIGTDKTITITVETEMDEVSGKDYLGYSTKTYTFTYTRNTAQTNNSLNNLEIFANSSDVLLTQDSFDSSKTSYEVRVDRNIDTATICVYLEDLKYSTIDTLGFNKVSTLAGISKYEYDLTLTAGTKNTLEFYVVSESGASKKYTINIHAKNAVADFSNLDIDGSLDLVTFAQSTTSYDLGTFPYSTSEIGLVLAKSDKYSIITIDGTVISAASGLSSYTYTKSLEIGTDKTITVTVETEMDEVSGKDYLGYSTKTYTFTYTRNTAQTNNSLNNLEIFANSSDVLLTQDSFDSTKSSYEVRVDRNIDTASIYVYLDDAKYSTIDTLGFNKVSTLAGISKYEYDLTLTAGTKNTLEFYVVSESGASKKYTINIHAKNAVADFSNLDIDGSLDLVTFAQSTTSYDLGTFPYSTSQIGIVLAKADKYSKITIDGTPISEASGISSYTYTKSLEIGTDKTITITVETEMDEVSGKDYLGYSTKTYTFTYTRNTAQTNNSLNNLEIFANSSDVLLTQDSFDSSKTSYEVRVDRNIDTATICVYLEDLKYSTIDTLGFNKVSTLVGISKYEYDLTLTAGAKNTLEFYVLSESGASKKYTINVHAKNAVADFSNLDIDGNLDLVTFAQSTTSYDLGTFPYSTSEIGLVLAKSDKYSIITIDGTVISAASGLSSYTYTKSLEIGTDKTITVTVETEMDEVSGKDYLGYSTKTYTFTYTRNTAQTNNSLNNLEIFANSSDVLLTQDSFDSSKTSYEVRVDRNIDTALIYVYLDDAKYSTISTVGFNYVSTTVGISKYEYDLTLTAGVKNTLEFYVLSESGASKKYTINVHAKNAVADFSNLDIDGSLDLVTFAQSTTSYDLGTFPYSTSQIGIVLAKADKYSKITIDGTVISEASGLSSYTYTKSLEIGTDKTITVTVETEMDEVSGKDYLGYSTKTYTFTYTRNAAQNHANLDDLIVNAIIDGSTVNILDGSYDSEVVFDSSILSYTVRLDRDITQIEIIPIISASYFATVTGGGSKGIVASTTSTYNVLVTAEDTTTSDTYIINIISKNDDNAITDLSIDGYTLDPEFAEDVLTYDLGVVPYTVSNIDIDASTSDSLAVLTGDGTKTLVDGLNQFTVYATSQYGTKGQTYTIRINRTAAYTNTNLNSLKIYDAVGGSELVFKNGSYVSGTYSYTLDLTSYNSLTKVKISYELLNSAKQTLTGLTNDQEFDIVVNGDGTVNQTIQFTVAAEQDLEQTYTINIIKGVVLSSETGLSALKLRDNTSQDYLTFVSGTYDYEADIEYAISSLNLTIDTICDEATVNFIHSLSGNIAVGETIVQFKVIAEDGTESEMYTIAITREEASEDNTLKEIVLTVDLEVMIGLEDKNPTKLVYDPATKTYKITVNEDYSDAIITVEKNNSGQSVVGKFNQVLVLSHGTNKYELTVTPEKDDALKATYTIEVNVVNSKNDITSLGVNGYTLDFDSAIHSYDLGEVTSDVSSINIFATSTDATYGTLEGVGTKVLVNGLNSFEVTATSEDGNSVVSYTIQITLVLSSNNTILDATLEDADGTNYLDFDPLVYEYTYKVTNSINQVTLNVNSTDDKATVVGAGTYALTTSVERVIEFYVVAEDGTVSSTYTITITREEASKDNTLKEIVLTVDLEVMIGLEDKNPTKLVYDPATKTYKITISENYSEAIITVEKNNSGQSVVGKFNQVLVLSHGTNKYELTVTPEKDDALKATYTIEVNVVNSTNDITSLGVDGYTLDFDSAIHSYDLGEVTSDVSSINIFATSTDATYGTLEGVGTKVLVNGLNSFEVTATSEDGNSVVIYTIQITLVLSSNNTILDATLEDADGTNYLDFDPLVYEYTYKVTNSINQVTLNVNSTDDKATVVGAGTYALTTSVARVIEFYVVAEDGTVSSTYTITITREEASEDNTLKEIVLTVDLEVMIGLEDKNPTKLVYDPATKTYKITISENYSEAIITVEKNNSGQSVVGKFNQVLVLSHGTNKYELTVTPEKDDALKATYTIEVNVVNSTNDITSLGVNGYTLDFDSAIHSYDLGEVTSDVSSINIFATSTDATYGTLEGVGTKVLVNGLNSFEVTATSEDGNSVVSYTIQITLVLSSNNTILDATLEDADGTNYLDFDPLVYEYTYKVTNSINQVTLNVNSTDDKATVVGAGTYALTTSVERVIEFYVVAEDGTVSSTYTITITREEASDDATIKELAITSEDGSYIVGSDTQNPKYVFSSSKSVYNITLDRSYEIVNLTYCLNDDMATSYGDEGEVYLTGGIVNSLKIYVTSESGKKKTYTINITVKNCDIAITNLGVTGYTLDFDSGTLTYDLGTVENTVSSVYISATKSDSYGIFSANANSLVSLAEGENNILVKATSEDGSTEVSYEIKVTREAAADPDKKSNDNKLYGLEIQGTIDDYFIDFDENIYTYDVDLKYYDGQVYLKPIIGINATVTGQGFHKIEEAETTNVSVTVTAEDGTVGKTYIVNLNRAEASGDTELIDFYIMVNGVKKQLTVTDSYQIVIVDPDVEEIEIVAIEPSKATITGTGIKTLQSSDDVYSILVTAENGDSTIYTVEIKKQNNDATLNSLVITDPQNGNNLSYSPEFDSNIYNYSIDLTENLTILEINIAATTTATVQSIIGLGTKILKSGTGETTDRYTIEVTAEDGVTTKAYQITITRNVDPDDSIAIDDLTLFGSNSVLYLGLNSEDNPLNQFTMSQTSYTIYVPYALKNVNLSSASTNGADLYGIGLYDLTSQTTDITFKIVSKSGAVQSDNYIITIIKEDPSEDNDLADLRINGTTISNFDTDTLDYEYMVDSNAVSTIVIAATANDNKSKISGSVGTLTVKAGKNIYNIVVTAENESIKTYSITINSLSYANEITSLSVNDYEISPLFDKETLVYSVSIPYDVSLITISATASEKATVVGDGIKADLNVGANNFVIYAISESGVDGVKYQLTVNREEPSDDTRLKSLVIKDKQGTVLDFTSEFMPSTRDYVIYVDENSSIMSVIVEAEANNIKATVYGTGNQLLEGLISGNYHTILKVTVLAENGSYDEYTISVYRGVTLDDIVEIESINLIGTDGQTYFSDLDFDESTLSYTINVPYSVTQTVLGIQSTGTVYGAGTKVFNSSSQIVYEFYVVSQSGTNQSSKYGIVVNREVASLDNNLNTITIDGVEVPNFDPEITSYTINKSKKSGSVVTLDAESNIDSSNIQGLGMKTLKDGQNTYAIAVTAESGAINTYTIIINYVDSDAQLANLVINGTTKLTYSDEDAVDLTDFTFDPDTYEYNVVVGTDTKMIKITGAAQDQLGAKVTGFGTYTIGTDVEKVRIYVTSADELITNIYTLSVSRYSIPDDNSLLANLSVENQEIAFDKSKYVYNMTVSSKTDSIRISAESFDPNASVVIVGYENIDASNEVSLSVDGLKTGQNVVLVKVTAENGVNETYYRMVIEKDKSQDLFTTVLLALSLILWIITVLFFIIINSKKKKETKNDELIY